MTFGRSPSQISTGCRSATDEWVLVTRADGKPYAWINADGWQLHRAASRCTTALSAGGSLFRPEHSLRQALDAALSSPSGLGVAVDDDGQLVGGVRADDVLEALNSQRREALPKLGSGLPG